MRIRERLHAHGLTRQVTKGFSGWHEDVRDTGVGDRCGGRREPIVLTRYELRLAGR
ncbi:hypothetical protein [Amycolatopsis sp. cmx-4-83]|uniref:hypothetical protein n=1 Tax=Amycolatopsis sp. cmx-4-83 TaxID=2790940 RepID=UPI00397AFFFF